MAVVRAWGAGGAKWLRGKEKGKKCLRHRWVGFLPGKRGSPVAPSPYQGTGFMEGLCVPGGALGECGVELPAGGRPPRSRGTAPPSRFQRQATTCRSAQYIKIKNCSRVSATH